MYDFRKTRITIKVNSSSIIYVYERNIILYRNIILNLFDWHQSVESLDHITENKKGKTQQEHEHVNLEQPVVNITGKQRTEVN